MHINVIISTTGNNYKSIGRSEINPMLLSTMQTVYKQDTVIFNKCLFR